MKLYHFTAEWMIEGCLREGLTKGQMVISDRPPIFKPNMQWLTSNKDFDQSWCRYSMLPYNRNDYRLTIKLPKSENLVKWSESGKDLTTLEMYKILSEFGDPENWYVYKGIIKPQWIRKVTKNPNL